MLFSLLALSQAQLKVTLQFGSAAPREVFVASELPKAVPEVTSKATGPSYDYSVPAFGGNDRIYVWDTSTNNIASKSIKDIQNGSWTVSASDYTLIGKLTVHVEHKGAPVQAAKVVLSTKAKSEEKLLDPTGKGDVDFFGYPAGDLKVNVAYNTTDKKGGSQAITFSEPVKRDKPEPVLDVAIADDVPTIAETPAITTTPPVQGSNQTAGQQPARPAEQGAEGSSFGKVILMIVSLIAIVFAGWWVFFMAKNKPKEFEATLQKLGVQVPSQQDPGAGAPIPVTPLAPAPPPPKIMLEDAEPVPLMAAVAVAQTPMVSVGEPTLVSESGQRITLSEGESLVGREDGLVVSLSGESTVSRRHASVMRSGKTAVLKDLGSTNGTFVNGTRLQGETALKPGDQVQFGSVRFRYES